MIYGAYEQGHLFHVAATAEECAEEIKYISGWSSLTVLPVKETLWAIVFDERSTVSTPGDVYCVGQETIVDGGVYIPQTPDGECAYLREATEDEAIEYYKGWRRDLIAERFVESRS
jgi:hypothetical protein